MAYIVKNCPCYQDAMYTFDAATGETKLIEKHICISPGHGGYCLKCSDCVIKKVIEDCKKTQQQYADCLAEFRDKYGKDRDEEVINWKMGRSHHALVVLSYFDCDYKD